jgi:hypothetical protein
MPRRLLSRFSVPLIICAEAAGGILVHDFASTWIAIAIVIVAVLATSWLLESGIARAVARWRWATRVFGARLGDDTTRVDGYWRNRIVTTNVGGKREVIGASLFVITPTLDGFDLSGHALMGARGLASWGGTGAAYGTSEIVYGYRGVENETQDRGWGIYSFYPGGKFIGSFYGSQLEDDRYREVVGERCPESASTLAGLSDEGRVEYLVAYLAGR